MEIVSIIYSSIFLSEMQIAPYTHCLNFSMIQCCIEKKRTKFSDWAFLISSCIFLPLFSETLWPILFWMVGPLLGMLTPFIIFFPIESLEVTSLISGEGNGTPLQYSYLEYPMDGGAWGVGHNWATSLSLFTFMHWRRKWQPTPVFLPGESQGQGSLVSCCPWGRIESDTTEET